MKCHTPLANCYRYLLLHRLRPLWLFCLDLKTNDCDSCTRFAYGESIKYKNRLVNTEDKRNNEKGYYDGFTLKKENEIEGLTKKFDNTRALVCSSHFVQVLWKEDEILQEGRRSLTCRKHTQYTQLVMLTHASDWPLRCWLSYVTLGHAWSQVEPNKFLNNQ